MSTDETTQTRVDLGDDLLEPTRTRTLALEPEIPESAPEKISSARILMGEGMATDAKKILRSILLNENERDYWVRAREALDEILKVEMNQLLKPSVASRPSASETLTVPDAEIREIEDRWGALDLSEAEDVLFSGDAAREQFIAGLEARLQTANIETRLDLVSGLIEMTLYRLAETVIRPLVQDAVYGPAAAELQVRIWMQTDRQFEATQLLEDFLSRPELAIEHRFEFFYLMGCAYQQMNRAQEARGWFGELLKRSGGYRDVEFRLSRLV